MTYPPSPPWPSPTSCGVRHRSHSGLASPRLQDNIAAIQWGGMAHNCREVQSQIQIKVKPTRVYKHICKEQAVLMLHEQMPVRTVRLMLAPAHPASFRLDKLRDRHTPKFCRAEERSWVSGYPHCCPHHHQAMTRMIAHIEPKGPRGPSSIHIDPI